MTFCLLCRSTIMIPNTIYTHIYKQSKISYYSEKARHKGSTSDYLVGGRQLGVLPVSISLMVSFTSTVMMLGVPAEAYTNGASYMLFVVGM